MDGRAPLQEWVDASTCVLLERDEGPAAAGQRPSLTLTVADGHPAAIAEVLLLSEVSGGGQRRGGYRVPTRGPISSAAPRLDAG